MVIMICSYKVKPGMVGQLVKEIQETQVEQLYRSQPGNVCFNYSVPVNDENKFYLTDVWETEEALIAHRSCEATPIWNAIKEKYIMESTALRYDI